MPTKPKSESERAPTPRERPPKQLSIATKRSARNWCGNSKRSRSSDGTIDDTFEEEPGRGWEAREVRPDPASDAVTVIIHPGSTNLRVGLHYAYAPIVIPHCIAFRRTTRSAPHDRSDHAATLLASASLESALVPLSRQLRVAMRLVGGEQPPLVPSVANASLDYPFEQSTASMNGPANGGDSSRFLVGQAALLAAVAAPEEWEVLHPWHSAGTNRGSEKSVRGLLTAIEQIWTCVICGGGGQKGLGLSRQQLSDACAVIALPDVFDRREGSDIISLLLHAESLGFKAAICHEEAACAAFGAGVGSACVVDIGGQRSTVCCVDEGMPMPGCRQILAYAGDDMDVLLHALIHRQGLTARLPALGRPPAYSPIGYGTASEGAPHQTGMSLSKIRHDCCTLDFNGPPGYFFAASAATNLETAGAVRVQLGSFAHVAPLLLFAPSVASSLQCSLGREGARVSSSSLNTALDRSDIYDDDFLTETAVDRALPSGLPPAPTKDVFVGAANFEPKLTPLGSWHTSGLTPIDRRGYTPLDEAIVRAVEKGKSTEVKRRLYGTILLLGGVGRTPGLAEYLEWRVAACWKLAEDSTEGIEKVEVVRPPFGIDPESVTWRGAAVLPSLPTARGLWILKDEWAKWGVLAAREACAFSW